MGEQNRPTIVCLCGSARFDEACQQANRQETLAGNIALTIGCDLRRDATIAHLSEQMQATIKRRLDELHLCKIDLADEILVVTLGGYVGTSTAKEISYAARQGKRIRWFMAETTAEMAHV